ncbi:MAG: DUF4185 domain-containing protein [Saprospiraceae bacterium]|nr:DUF4185 domain-containing protein [Saprospiraceae bacterium]
MARRRLVNQERDNTLYLFAYHIEVTGRAFWLQRGGCVADGECQPGQAGHHLRSNGKKTPLHVNLSGVGEGSLGAGILANTKWAGAPHPDGYVYVYGCLGKDKNLVAARVKPKDFENFKKWRYWDGKSWTLDIQGLAPITNAVSNELSVTPLPDGRYALIFQVLGLSDKVGMRICDSPVGPFGEIQEIWRTPEADEGLFATTPRRTPISRNPASCSSATTL